MPDVRAEGGQRVSGMITEADSGLRQFEIVRYSDGVVDDQLPCVVWVDRKFPIRKLPSGVKIEMPDNRVGPGVCACMGNFIE